MKLSLLIILLFSGQAMAGLLQSKIHSIDTATQSGDPHLIQLDNGQVVFVEYEDRALLNSFKNAMEEEAKLKLRVDDKNNFLSAETLEDESQSFEGEPEAVAPMSYEPSTVSSSEATNIFRRMRRDYQNQSQCYNRAHVWTWEEYKKTGLKSTKHFLFFTRRYIRNYRYKWWFHVSPSVNVAGMGDRILDRRYTSGHRSLASWTSNFIYSGRSCPIVHKYYDYRNHQEEEDCYLIPVSMYFWQPRDIEKRDRTGYEKTQYYKSETDYAYWEAF